MKLRKLSVKEVNSYAQKLLSYDPILNNIIVEGEISNFTAHSSGHAYFTLKDDEARISCIMFSRYFSEVEDSFKNGDQVDCKGDISIFVRDGKFQLYVKEMKKAGLGALHIKFEDLKKQYKNLGYFKDEHKKEIPKLPKKIGIITSDQGAAIEDVISVFNRRSTLVDALVYPVSVQGDYAKDEIVKAIEYFNNKTAVDLIIMTRGGGSIEDLWAFNEPIVVESVFHSNVPIISGVGHETDFTLVDFVADLRAPTPSAAAEVAMVSNDTLKDQLEHLKEGLINRYKEKINSERKRLEALSLEKLIIRKRNQINQRYQNLDNIHFKLNQLMNNIIKSKRNKLESLILSLNHNNPIEILSKGYSITMNVSNDTIRKIDDVTRGEKIFTKLNDGLITSEVIEITGDDENE
jgi:exodeoxyribonuclease VII large subunit